MSKRKTACEFDPGILEIFDGYVHGHISKREFIRRAGAIAVAGMGGAMLLKQLQPDYALAAQVPPDDPAISTEWIEYGSPQGHGIIKGLMAKPASITGKLPAVLVVHENRGLNPYIEDVVRRVAKAGYLTLGPDGLTPLGGYPGNDDDGRRLQGQLDRRKLMNDFFAAFEYLRDSPQTTGKVGCVGFCFGGTVCNALAVTYPDLAASAPFYGSQPASEDVPAIQAPLMLHYAGLDRRVNAGWEAYADALEENGKQFSVHFYKGVYRGFHNDTTPRYDEVAAKLAWLRTLAFFETYLD